MRLRGVIFTTIINPIMIWGVNQSFAFLTLFLFFAVTIFIRPVFGNATMFFFLSWMVVFYRYSMLKSRQDPFWFNVFLMALIFERRDPIAFIKRLLIGDKKKIYR